MSTPDELDALAKAMDSSKPWIVGLVLSWGAWGGVLMQIAILFGGDKSSESRWRKAALLLIFGVATLDMVMNLKSMINTMATEYGNLDNLLTYIPTNGDIMMPFLELAILFLCQVFLLHRCLAFAKSFHGRLTVVRCALAGALLLLASTAFATGAVSQAITWGLASLVEIQAQASDQGQALFQVLQAIWLSTSLAVDVGLALTITVDLCQAMSFGSNDVGVGANVRQILVQLVAFATVNGLFLVAFQLAFLVAIMLDNVSWTDGALVFLPQLQLLSVLTLVNLPRTTVRVQASDSQRDSAGRSRSGGLPTPAASRPPRSPLQRGRRKLAPLAGRFSRGSRPAKTSDGWSVSSEQQQREGPALDFLEMLEATSTTSGSVLFQR